MRAFNGTTASAYSNQASVTPTVSPPAAPSNLVATVLPGTQIRLIWTDNATHETHYSVERSTDGSTWSPLAILGANSTSYMDTSVVTGMRYHYRVRAFAGNTPSAYSNQVSVSTTVSPLAAPSNLVATVLSGTQIRLTWTDHATNETGFYIERAVYHRDSNFGRYTPIATVGANVTSYIDATVMRGRWYGYRIRAFNNSGTSAYSNLALKLIPASGSLLTAASVASHTAEQNHALTHVAARDALRLEPDRVTADYLTALLGSSPTQTLFRSLARVNGSGNGAVQGNGFNDQFQFVVSL